MRASEVSGHYERAALIGVVIGPLVLGGWYIRNLRGNTALNEVRNASSDMRVALVVGVNFADYSHKVQILAAALLRAEEEHCDKRRMAPYQVGLDY